jgi:hypothetical protein
MAKYRSIWPLCQTSRQSDQMSLWKNRPRCSPNHFVSKLLHYFYFGKLYIVLKIGLILYFFVTAQSKQSPNRQKFAQSGHPVQPVKQVNKWINRYCDAPFCIDSCGFKLINNFIIRNRTNWRTFIIDVKKREYIWNHKNSFHSDNYFSMREKVFFSENVPNFFLLRLNIKLWNDGDNGSNVPLLLSFVL